MDTMISNNIPYEQSVMTFSLNPLILDLSYIYCIREEDEKIIVDKSKNNNMLTTLIFGRNAMTSESTFNILNMAKNKPLKTLIFDHSKPDTRMISSFNIIGKKSFDIIVYILTNSMMLTTLHLIDCNIHYGIIKCLVLGVKNNKVLTTLDLSRNNINSGLDQLFDILNSTIIEKLNLSYNIIHSEIDNLSIALESNNTLKYLDLSNNHINIITNNTLFVALKINTTLEYLDLSNNVRDGWYNNMNGIILLCETLTTNKSLKTLNLKNNNLDITDELNLIKSITCNTTLTALYFEEWQGLNGYGYKDEIIMYLENNYIIRELTTSGGDIYIENILKRNNNLYQNTFWSKSMHCEFSPEMHSLVIALYLMNGEFTVVLPHMVLNYILQFFKIGSFGTILKC